MLSGSQLDYKELEQIMRPGKLSTTGFLGDDECLEGVLREDEETVMRRGLKHEQIADRIEYFIKGFPTTFINDKEGIIVDRIFKVRVRRSDGWQECPWGDAGGYRREDIYFDPSGTPKRYENEFWPPNYDGISEDAPYNNEELIITNTEMDETLTIPGLIVHLVKEHHFYEGKGVPFRTDPEQVSRILGLIK